MAVARTQLIQYLPGKTPVDVHRKLDDFAFKEQFPGYAVHIPLSQNGVSDWHLIDLAGFSFPAIHT